MSKVNYSIKLVLLLFTCLAVSSASAKGKGYTETKYPVVLLHGWLFGFDKIGPLDMFYGITDSLIEGGTKVYTPNRSSANSTAFRGEQTIEVLDELNAIHGYGKFNLIGHSHGGFDARYIASVRPDLVASVTTIGSPASGSELIDYIVDLKEKDPLLDSIIINGLNIIGSITELLSNDNDPQDNEGALYDLSSEGAAVFSSKHPNGVPKKWCGRGKHKVNGIRYYSMMGNKQLTNIFDSSDYSMIAASMTFRPGVENDGAAGRCASHLGKVLKDNYSWNHVDQVNNLFGLIGWGAAHPPSVYRTHVNRLKKKGL